MLEYVQAGASIASSLGSLSKLFGGGGDGYATGTGYELKGTLSRSGFSGELAGISSNGKTTYRITDAQSTAGERQSIDNWLRANWSRFFGDQDATIPIDLAAPYDWKTVISRVEQGLSQLSGQPINTSPPRMDAPTINAAQPPGTPTAVQVLPPPGSAPEPSPTLALMSLTNDRPLMLILAGIVLWAVFK